MTVRADMGLSLDGFATGEGQSLNTPFGHAGFRLLASFTRTAAFAEQTGGEAGSTGIDNAFATRYFHGIGAEIMGAGKFGPPGWQDDPDWRGWWGADPVFHYPVFVLTHRPRPSLEMEGGTTFHFRTATPAEALATATEAAAGKDVRIGGGATTTREFLAAGLVDVLHVSIEPFLLGRGVRLWDGLEGLEAGYDVETVATPDGVTHLTFTRS